ncbi:hypothetical protein OG909_20200 [Streptomyces sp. NBC_01754]|uniref:hypothetical protein n=1 Tax=Streptomyces sp. NBC_01754 TaxID=2975930 RepID=UPI002DDA5B89|nr:hypothetical protein [Streptomyces sp. NBC_01754]WSC94407.1 hypothetical protein OG909_20200 [Streptomyces sp. NBC_01754]
MPDRLRTAYGHPLPERASTLMRERQSSSPDPSTQSGPSSASGSSSGSGSSGSGSSGSGAGSSPGADDNPFAAPPEGRPDQPWQPRRPSQGDEGDGDGRPSDDRPVWGSQWSDRQPGRQDGGFGGRSGGPRGQGGPEGKPGGPRWDPTDPAQRRARYAVLGGMWAFFFALFDFPEIALLLGSLSVYWAVSSLRAGPRRSQPSDAESTGGTPGGSPDRPAATAQRGAVAGTPQNNGRQLTTAAVSGLVTALLALSIVATSYTVQLVYRDYYTCVNDALTKSGALACNKKLPDPLEPFFGVRD